jgi:hypothetical protein
MIRLTSNLKSISVIFSNFVIPISLIIGGIWTLNTFSKRKEEAALLVKIENIKSLYSTDRHEFFLHIEVIINNTGNRDLDLLYQNATIKVFKFNPENNGSLTLMNQNTGLVSHSSLYTGRIRPKDEQKMPYLIEIEGPGIYFVEFSIDVDMKKYYKPDQGPEIKTWVDGTFIKADKRDFK